MKLLKQILMYTVIAIGVLWFVMASRPFKPSGNFLVHQPAANFTLLNLAGENIEFDQLRQGKKVLLFFWATWCPHCREQMVNLPRIIPKLKSKGVELILVNVGEPPERVKQYLLNTSIALDTLLDTSSQVSYAYQAIGLPWFVLIDEKGMIEAADFQIP